MKFCIIGAGVQGSATAAVLARDRDAEKIVLADYDIGLAGRVAETIGCERLVVAQADANDVTSLMAAARGCDVILNLVDQDYAGRVRQAAVQAGIHYVDSAADARLLRDIAFEGLVRDDEVFRAAGLCGVVGAGWSPGVTNVLVRRAADQLDELDAIHLRLGFEKSLWIDAGEVAHAWRPHWSPEGALKDFSEPSLFFTGGKPTLVGPFANAETYDFGGRIGELLLTSHYHEESFTLPVFLGKGIAECDVRYPVNEQAATLVAMGMGDPDRVVEVRDGTRVKPFDVVMALVRRPVEEMFFAQTHEAVRVSDGIDRAIHLDVTGRKDGVAVALHTSWYLPGTPESRLRLLGTFGTVNVWVAVPIIATAKLIGRGRVPVGVSMPEQLDPSLLLEELASAGYPLDLQEERTVAMSHDMAGALQNGSRVGPS